jgi:RNA polymerase sigma-70 factor, ECF subfamily
MSTHSPDLTQAQSLPRLTDRERKQDRSELECEVVALFDEYRDRMLAFVTAFGLTGHDAEEVVQEVFLSLFRHLIAGRPRSNLRGWIFRVAHNLALKRRYANQQRQKWIEPEDSRETPFYDPSPTPEEHAVCAQRRQRMLSAVKALSEQDRLCFTLRADGLRYREIAHVLGISLGSVALSLTRSITRLMRVAEM